MTHVRRWGAVYLLLLLFLGSWAAQFFTQLIEYRNTQREHGQAFEWSGYWPDFLASTFENWQSEWLQLVFQAILLLGAKHWIFRVDAQDTERIEAKIDDLRALLLPADQQTPMPVHGRRGSGSGSRDAARTRGSSGPIPTQEPGDDDRESGHRGSGGDRPGM